MNPREPGPGPVELGDLSETLSAIPHLLGFHPEESLVIVCLHGERRRLGLVLRIDLPDVGEPGWVSEIVARVRYEQACGVVVACYTDAPGGARAEPRRALIDALCAGLEDRGVQVHDAALVRDGRRWSYMCREPSCCPPDGVELGSMSGAAARLGAERTFNGRGVLPSRAELAAGVAGPTGERLTQMRAAVAAGEQELRRVRRDEGADGARSVTTRWVEAVWAAYSAGACGMADEVAGRICAGVVDPEARDRVASMPVGTGGGAQDGGVWLAMLSELARRSPDESAAPACTLLAWVAYQFGEGALANVALERALRVDPAYRMAQMLADSLNRQISPEAIREVSRAVWERLDTSQPADGAAARKAAG
ncbi:uncharacterized protein DUF4192 [Haloactinopolyspora alba]|uniref:Uncharacterized protein DUF4192 n=1 Tax=Haloactinopolyspora alba TaxID=648780 RepID=A0A2P8DR76_9ACTN|nr:DUF4192 domain-containing protein [Haloactinopolyspora alba]PSK99717.1 uncharacterized protein DUF4192 [Haloactinopolyspora alba]